jgi:hypothetical protein
MPSIRYALSGVWEFSVLSDAINGDAEFLARLEAAK